MLIGCHDRVKKAARPSTYLARGLNTNGRLARKLGRQPTLAQLCSSQKASLGGKRPRDKTVC